MDRAERNRRDRERQKARYLTTSSARWRAIRKAQLERFPLCAHCGEPANEADHIESDTSRNVVGVDLQSLCKPCHSRKTAGLGVRGCDADGWPLDPNHRWKKSLGAEAVESAAHPFLHR